MTGLETAEIFGPLPLGFMFIDGIPYTQENLNECNMTLGDNLLAFIRAYGPAVPIDPLVDSIGLDVEGCYLFDDGSRYGRHVIHMRSHRTRMYGSKREEEPCFKQIVFL